MRVICPKVLIRIIRIISFFLFSSSFSNIDIRIRQAELEYALGREELHLLSLVEEIRALQCRLDKSLKTSTSKSQSSLHYQLSNGLNMSLWAVNANVGCFGINVKVDGTGIYVDWVSDGEPLFRGDRILECNGKILSSETKEDIQNLLISNNKCDLVLIRTRSFQQNHMLLQSQEDNRRLQHRISYLEDQVKELQRSTRDIVLAPKQTINRQQFTGDHVTKINISDDKPQIFQRGNFIATIIDGKAIQAASEGVSKTTSSITSGNSSQQNQSSKYIGFGSTSKISINNCVNSSHSFLKQKDKNREQYKENHRIHRGTSDRHNSHPDLLHADVSTKILYF